MNSNEMLRKLSAGRVGHYSGFFPPEVLLGFARYCAARAREHARNAQKYRDAAASGLRVAASCLREIEAAVERRATYSQLCWLACEASEAAAVAALFSGERVCWERAYDELQAQGAWLEKMMMY